MTEKVGTIGIPENLDNPIIEPLKTLFLRINDLNGLIFHLETYVSNYCKHIRDYMKNLKINGNPNRPYPVAGAAVVIRDLSEFPDDRWARYYSVSVFSTTGQEYINIANNLISQGAAFTISQAYEAFETFLKEMLSAFLTNNSNNAVYQEQFFNIIEKLNREPKKIINKEIPENWSLIISNYFNNNDLFKLLREISHEITDLEKHNNRSINLATWYKVITEVRHGLTHCKMLIKKERLSNLTKIESGILKKMVEGEFSDSNYIMRPTSIDAQDILERFDEYAFMILKCLSKLESYEIPTFEG